MDVRTEHTRKAIKDALAELLKEKNLENVSMSELARTAGVSRSTLYSNYANVSTVYEQLVRDFLNEVSPMDSQLRCRGCQTSEKREPYCVAVRNTEKYGGVVRQRQYLSTMFGVYGSMKGDMNALAPYLHLGVDEQSALDLVRFQITGCHALATMSEDNEPWERKKQLIDTFIAGGMRAVRNG